MFDGSARPCSACNFRPFIFFAVERDKPKINLQKYFYLHVVLQRGVPIAAAISILLELLENSEGTLSQFSLPRFVPSLP